MSLCLALGSRDIRASDPPREWTSTDGRKLTASLAAADGDDVTLILSGGQKVSLPAARLSQADQDHIAKWKAAEALRATSFSLKVENSRQTALSSFVRGGSGARGFTGLGKAISTSVTNFRGILYTVEASDDHIMQEVGLAMLPPKKSVGAPQTLDVAKLSLIYRNPDRTEGKATVGPRWEPADSNKMGSTEKFEMKNQEPLKFNVGFVIPKNAVPLSVNYEGTASLSVPLR